MDFYYQSENKDFNLILGDTMETLNHIGQKVDMIFADPPYFLSQGRTRCINGTWKSFEKGEWDRATSLDNINAFNMKWLSKCRDVLKDSGTIFVSGTYHNIFSVATCMVELGYKILNIIVWQKRYCLGKEVRESAPFLQLRCHGAAQRWGAHARCVAHTLSVLMGDATGETPHAETHAVALSHYSRCDTRWRADPRPFCR